MSIIISGLVVLLSAFAAFVAVKEIHTANWSRRSRIAVFLITGLLYGGYLAFVPYEHILLTYALILASAVVFGILLGPTLRSSVAVMVFIVTAALVDLFSFSDGLTHAIIESYKSEESMLLLKLTLRALVNGETLFVIGVGDLLILSVLFAGLLQLKKPAVHAFAAPVLGLLAALVTGHLTGGIFAIPFVAVVVIGYLLVAKRSR